MGRDDERLVEIVGEIEHETERAWLVSNGDFKEWLPKSEVTDNSDGTFSVPLWLARRKGLV